MSESKSNNKQVEGKLRDRATQAIDIKIADQLEKKSIGVKDLLGVKEVLHELQVHQIELEMQNEELSKSSESLEESRNEYQTLYEFAPIGYFSLGEEGIIQNSNLCGSSLLKTKGSLLINKAFQHFVSKEYKSFFHAFLRRVFSVKGKQSCELKITAKDGTEFYALVEGVVLEKDKSRECLTAVIDISEQKKAQEIIKTSLEERERVNIVIATQEEERKRISEALHNSIAQLLYAAQIKLEMFMDSEKNRSELIHQVHDLIQTSLNETRTISFELMPPILRDFGLKETVKEFCIKKGNSNLEIGFTFPGVEKRIDNFIEVAVYRIVQELLNNIEKHSKASKANVHCEIVKGYIKIIVEDNGIGFSEDTAMLLRDKMGLRNIKHRVRLMNGNIYIKTAKGEGTIISIEIPVE